MIFLFQFSFGHYFFFFRMEHLIYFDEFLLEQAHILIDFFLFYLIFFIYKHELIINECLQQQVCKFFFLNLFN